MYCIGHLSRGVDDVIDPRSRKINFDDSPAQAAVVNALRYAWYQPQPPEKTIKKYIGELCSSNIPTANADFTLPEVLQNEEDSAWSREIYHMCP